MPVDPSHVNPLHCHEVSEACPVKASIYGYYPSLGLNAFLTTYFGLCFFINLWLGWRYRTWTYQIAMSLACVSSAIGYIGRCTMYNNPFYTIGFQIQISCLTFAPAFNSAALYLILKHLIIQMGREWSRIRPKYYTWAFIFADFLALTLQGAGGGIAGSAGDDASFRDVGDTLMITGISWQVLTLLLFGAATAEYTIRRFRSTQPLSPSAQALIHDKRFGIYIVSLLITFICIFTRCVYRIAEMANGWRNPIMQNQGLFIGLDSVMVGIATLLQTFVHPGHFFPPLATYQATKRANRTPQEVSSSESSVEKALGKTPEPKVLI